jgi:hypothetical protein
LFGHGSNAVCGKDPLQSYSRLPLPRMETDNQDKVSLAMVLLGLPPSRGNPILQARDWKLGVLANDIGIAYALKSVLS